ncbi:MAG: tetratricopeptide repeat protein [Anaerolineae bacterium]|nr:tetratricopeptide repeat protein [Anaerolineae bacterium]
MTRPVGIVFLAMLLFSPLPRGWGALQRNYAFVVLNQLPSLFTSEIDSTILARTETQLRTALRYHPEGASTWRTLALVQRAQGTKAPAGLDAYDLLQWGWQKQQGGDWAAASYLYQWATAVAPELGDTWYRLGSVYQAQENWTAASQAYEQALATNQFGDTAAQAATHYQLGELLLWQNGDPATAVPHYRAALAINPTDHWAQLRLGYALYWSAADVVAAETEILAAIAQWPDEKYLKWPYFYLGEIYENAGLSDQAIAAYERVIALDPADERVLARLALLRSR